MILIDQVQLQHSQKLERHIKAKINANDGKIPFSDYMQQVLYTPGLGYYNTGTIKFGPGGDFITAPELGSLFAKCVARQVQEILTIINANTFLELGAGSGQFACDLLLALNTQKLELKNYFILELSADLRLRQQEKILQLCPQFAHMVQWLEHLPNEPINGVIFANEVIDAMPVARFNYAADRLQEYYVTADFKLVLDQPSTELLTAFSKNDLSSYISQPYTSEINLQLTAWINSLSACLQTGAILLCDYGFPRAEYYHPQRNQGTFMCHYQHRCHDNPFINIGLQDLTAHVDFTTVAEAADTSGLNIAGFVNLASFLINCDISEFLTAPSVQQSKEINTLTSPTEMGELFKFIVLLKEKELQLQGFKQFDKSHCL